MKPLFDLQSFLFIIAFKFTGIFQEVWDVDLLFYSTNKLVACTWRLKLLGMQLRRKLLLIYVNMVKQQSNTWWILHGHVCPYPVQMQRSVNNLEQATKVLLLRLENSLPSASSRPFPLRHIVFPLNKLSSNNSHVQQLLLVPFAKSGEEHYFFTKRMDKDRCSLAGSMTNTYG